MPVAASLVAEVKTTGVSEAESQLKGMGSTVEKTGGFFKGMLGNMLSIAGGIGIANLVGTAFGFLKDQLGGVLQESMDAQDELAQTNKVLLSTHDASGMTSQAILDLASNFSHLTKFTDDQVQVGENMLLTFTNIGKNVFPQATQTMLDLSQAMGQDVKSSAIQLGKALNDPLTGMTALQRVGVTFDDTEKKLIKTYMSHNELAKAQGVILQELQKEFGGSAEAAGKTFAGQLAILHQRLDDVKQTIGDALLPILTKLMGFVSDHVMPIFNSFATWIGSSAIPGIEQFADSLSPLLGLLKGLGQDLGVMFSHLDFGEFNAAWKSFTITISGFLGPLYKVKDGLNQFDFSGIVEQIGTLISQGLGKLTDILWGVQSVMITIMPHFYDLADAVGKIDFGQLVSGAKQVGQVFLNFSPGINLFQALSRHAQDLGKWFQTSVVPALKQAQPAFEQLASVMLHNVLPAISTISDIFHNTFQRVFDALLPVFEKAIPIIIRFAGVIASGLGPAIQFLTPYIVQAAEAIGQFAGDIATRVAPIIENWFDMMNKALTNFLVIWNAVWPYLGPILQGVWDEIVGVIKIAWALVKGIVEIGLDLLSGNWKQAWEDFKSMLSGVWDGIKQVLKGAWEIIAGWATGAWKLIASAISAPIQAVGNWLAGAWNTFKNDASIAWHNITSTIMNVVNGVTSWLKTTWQNAVNTVVGWFNWLYNHNYYFKALVDTIRNVIGAVVTWLTDTWHNVTGWISHEWAYLTTLAEIKWAMVQYIIQSKIRQVEQFVHNVLASIGNFFTSQWNTLVSKTQDLWNRISGVFSGAWNKYIAGPLGSLGNSIGNFFSGLANKAFTWGASLIQGLIDGLNSKLKAVGDAASNVASKITSILGFHHSIFTPPREGPASRADHWMPDFVQGIADGITAGMPTLQSAMSKFAGTLSLSPGASPGFGGTGHYAFPSMVGAASSGGGGSKQPVHIHVDVGTKELASVLVDDIMDLAARNARLNQPRRAYL